MPFLLSFLACNATDPSTSTLATSETSDTSVVPSTTVGALRFAGAAPSRLLVISLDTTRRDHIGRFSGSGLTPNLDAVMAEAVVLEDHRSCSNWTGPSMTCVVSGRTPMENGFWPWTGDPMVRSVPEAGYGDGTLPGRFTAEGFATTLVTANHVFSRDLFTSVGFETEVRVDWSPAVVVREAAMEALDELPPRRPWYLHVHFIDPHGTYCAPDEFLEAVDATDAGLDRYQWCYDSYGAPDAEYWSGGEDVKEEVRVALEGQYSAELLYWDSEFGRFWEQLEESGALDDTLVMFVTDHGQQLYERGYHGHGIELGSEENRSTAWFWARNLEPMAFTRTTFHPDLTATLYGVFGVVPTLEQTGRIVGTAPPDRAVHAINTWGFGDVRLSVARGDRQLLYDWWGPRAYYRLDEDPAGLTDVYDPTDPEVLALWAQMDPWIAEVQRYWPHLATPIEARP